MRSLSRSLLSQVPFALLLVSSLSHAAVFNVTPTTGGNCAVDPNDCTLQEALNEARKNQQPDTINLAAGTYDASQNLVNKIPSPFSYVAQGGPNENFALEIVGAENGGTVITGADIYQGLSIITATLVDDSAADVTIRGVSFKNTTGAVAVQTKSADLIFERNTQENNKQGLIFDTEAGAVKILGNTIRNEQAPDNYIAIQATSIAGPLEFKDNVIRDIQSANQAGGVSLKSTSGSIEVSGNTWQSNKLQFCMDANTDAALSFRQNKLIDNEVTGGASFIVALSNNAGDILVEQNSVLGNQKAGLSGMYILSQTGKITLDRNIFSKNSGQFTLGAFSNSGEVLLTNNLLSGNEADLGVVGAGGAKGNSSFVHNTIVDNQLLDPTGAALKSGTSENSKSVSLYNNIFYNNLLMGQKVDIKIEDDIDKDQVGSSIVLSHNIFSSLTTTCVDPCISKVTQMANLDQDPRFLDTAADDYRPGLDSPALAAGAPDAPFLPPVDLAGVARGTPPDIGAYQSSPNLSVDPVSVDFGNVSIGEESSRIVTLGNLSVLELKVTEIALSDTANYALDFNKGDKPCGSAAPTLTSQGSCTLELSFSPSVEGSLEASLTISSNDPDAPSTVVALKGVGTNDSGGGCSLSSSGNPVGWIQLGLLSGFMFAVRKSKRRNYD